MSNNDKTALTSPVAPEQVVASPTTYRPYCLNCEKEGHRTRECHSTYMVGARSNEIDLLSASPEAAPAAPLLMQDENSGRDGRRYNEWHASRPDARLNAREAAAATPVAPSAVTDELVVAAKEAVRWLNSWFRNHDGNKIADALSAALAKPAPVQAACRPITAFIAVDTGGDEPAYCLMAAYRSEADATNALNALSEPVQAGAQQAVVELPGVELEREEGWVPVKNGVPDDHFLPHAMDLPALARGWEWTAVTRVMYAISLAAPTQAGAGDAKGGD